MYVSLDYVVTFAKTIVKTADHMDTNIWKDWVYTGALLHLGVGDDEIDVAEITPVDTFFLPLPENCRSILDIALFDSSGNELLHKYRAGKQRIYNDQRINVTTTGTPTNNTLVPVDVSSDNYNIILGTNGGNVAKAKVRYFKYPLDQNNQPLIREEDVYACAMFIKLMQAMRDNSNRSEIQQYDALWKQAADKAKADKRSKSITPEVLKTIARDWMKLIPQFNQRLF